MGQVPKMQAPGASPRLCKGDWVRVRPLEAIRATLDAQEALEFLPFMPEMRRFCGGEFQVNFRLEKTCVEGLGARLLPDTVTLVGLHCDGSAHDGCQRRCPILWKEAWLERIAPLPRPSTGMEAGPAPVQPRAAHLPKEAEPYYCQSTELGRATRYLFPLSATRCTLELRVKNVGVVKSMQFLWIPLVVKIKRLLFGLGAIQPTGRSSQTPLESLELIPGEWVEVKTPEDIQATVDPRGRNRGLEFTPQMLPFCGGVYRVKGRVDRAILETTGRMRDLKNTVILEGVTCDGHTVLGGCSRHVHHLWREAWLRRVEPPGTATDAAG